jgi:ABC-type multidrug transport system fused ATPase/permease subunit
MLNWIARLPVLEKFVHYWRIFRRDTGKQLWLYLFLTLQVTLVESVGIGLFFPLMTGLQNEGGAKSKFEQIVADCLAFLGLEYRLENLLVCIVVIFMAKALIQFAAAVYQSKIVAQYQANISKRIFEAISSQEYKHFLSRNIGLLANASVGETSRATSALMRFATLFPSLISILIFSFLAFKMDWVLTLGVLGFGFLVMLLMRYVSRIARSLSYQNAESYGQLNDLVLQSFGAFKYLRSTMGLNPLRRKVDRTIDRLANGQFRISVTSNFSQILTEPVAILLLVGMLWHQTIIAKNPLAQVVVLALFFYRLIKEVMIFQSGWHGFSATMGSIDLVSSIISESARARENFSGKPYPGIAKAIRFEKASFSYGRREVIHELSLSIPKHSMVAIVGESGSGKSTFVDLLTGLQRPSQGAIFLDEISFAELDVSTFRPRIGYVTQEPALFNDTILQNISLWDGRDPVTVRNQVLEAAEAANCREFIEEQELGFDTLLGDRGVNLSGGQRQRIAIARELYKKPDLLILDEATSALDSETEMEIQKSIEGLRGKLTTVVIAHRLSTIRNADLIYVFSSGRVVEEGQFAALYSRTDSYFRKYCDLQGLS